MTAWTPGKKDDPVLDCLKQAFGMPLGTHLGAPFVALLHRLGQPAEPRAFSRARRAAVRPDRTRPPHRGRTPQR